MSEPSDNRAVGRPAHGGAAAWSLLPAAVVAAAAGLGVILALTAFTIPERLHPGATAGAAEREAARDAPSAPHGEDARTPDADLDAIVELVAQYRRTADDTWRRKLAVAVHREADAAGLDPLLVAAIVATESSFQSRAVSSAGAVGLMQLRPFVARAVAARHSVDWHGPDALHDPHINVRLGVRYYTELLARFGGDEVKALTAYNYGPTRVSRQLLSSTYRGSRYADDVLGLYARLAQNRTAPLRASSIGSRATS